MFKTSLIGLHGIGGQQGETTAYTHVKVGNSKKDAQLEISMDSKGALIQLTCPPWVAFSRVDGVYELNQLANDDLLELEESGDALAHVSKRGRDILDSELHGYGYGGPPPYDVEIRIDSTGGRFYVIALRVYASHLPFQFKFIRPAERFPYLFSPPLDNPTSENLSYNLREIKLSYPLLEAYMPVAKKETAALRKTIATLLTTNVVYDPTLEKPVDDSNSELAAREAVLDGHGGPHGHGGVLECRDIRVTNDIEFSSSSPLQGAIREGSSEPERVDSSSAKALSAKRVEMPSCKDSQPAMCDAQSSISKATQVASKSIFLTPSPNSTGSPIEPIDKGENTDGIRRLLRIENTCCVESIFVGVVVHEPPSEYLEFFFFKATDMLRCVGVGLSQAKVIVHNDLTVTVEGTTISDRELKDTWMPFLKDKSSHLVMKVEMQEATGMQSNEEEHVQTFVTEEGEIRSLLCGVGFSCSPQYVDETYDAAEVSWPRLYDMALFILTTNDQCSETNGNSSSQQSGSSQGNMQNNMGDQLHRKQDSVFNNGNLQGEKGDGDGDAFNGNQIVLDEDDLPPVVFRVTVYPLPKDDIIGTPMKPPRLKGAYITPKLVFDFRQNRFKNRISIKAQTHLELVSKKDVFRDTNLFGWYHDEIRISFGCKGHQESGRLDPGSCSILNHKTPKNYTAAKSRSSTRANTLTIGGQASINVWGNGLQGSAGGSGMNQEAISVGENIEMPGDCVCEGFSFKNSSSNARASFLLFYPLEDLSIWDDRKFLHRQGLISTIEPSIQGTWIPISKHVAAHYSFKVERSLNFHERAAELSRYHRQKYVLPFFVNHAMTHLRNQRNAELHGNQQSIPDVLMVGSANMSPQNALISSFK